MNALATPKRLFDHIEKIKAHIIRDPAGLLPYRYIVPTAIVQSLQVGTPIGSGEAVRFSCRAVVSGSYTTLA